MKVSADRQRRCSQSEARPGFGSCLMEVITSKDSAPHVDVRLMASVYFKNSINRYWRHRRDSVGISNEEKLYLKQKLLSHFGEENYQIAQTLAVLVSKIARIDYPKEWPELFSVLAQKLQSADILSSHRICLTLFRTLKELSTKRLMSDQKTYAESDVKTLLHGFSTFSLSYNTNTLEQHHDELYLTCERWLLCLKIIRQLIVSGFPSDAQCVQEVRPVMEVSPMLLNAIQSFLPYYSSFQKGHPKFLEFLKRACTKLMKVLIALQGRHPYSFSDKCVLPAIVDFCLQKITDPDPDVSSFEHFLIQCMVMIKAVLQCKEYKPSSIGRVMDENGITLDQMKKNMSGAVSSIMTSLMTRDRIIALCSILIRRYFVLTPSDLEEWYQNPESFHHEQDMVQWTEKLRPCSEALYIVLFENHSQLLGPVVVSILQEAMNGCPTSVTEITPGLLLKDAAYGAASYVYYELSNYLSFKDWFNGALSLELSNDHPNMRIVRRKVAVVLGQWVSEIKEDTKRPVYCALIRLLQDKDLCVRLAACRSLCSHIEHASFSKGEFIDLLPICWDSSFILIEEVQEFDSKVQVLNLISVLIGHVSEVIPFVNKLVLFFQKVWEESSGECHLQIQLLIALMNFVVALGYRSPVCYNTLLPLLQKGIDINSPDELNLLEDSMLLWEATLSQAPSMAAQLLAYFPCLVEILERSFDHLQTMSNRPPGGQDWSFDAGHSNSADAASLISYMKMGRGHGSINAYIRVTGGFYLVLCDTLRSDDLEVQGNERSFMLDENTTKCFIIDRRIVITACGGTDRQDDLWNTIDIKYDDAKENFPDEELPDVHDIKGWIDEYMTTYKAFDPDGVDVFIIGYSRVHNTCIALISRDLSNGGLDLSLANYPYDQLHEVISSGFKDVLTIWVEMEIDKRINVETNEMSYNYALNFLKHGFLEASLNDLEVGGSFEGIILSLEQVKQ